MMDEIDAQLTVARRRAAGFAIVAVGFLLAIIYATNVIAGSVTLPSASLSVIPFVFAYVLCSVGIWFAARRLLNLGSTTATIYACLLFVVLVTAPMLHSSVNAALVQLS